MRHHSTLKGLPLAAAITLALSASQALAQVTAIKAGRLLDPASGQVVTGATIVVENGRIVAVGPNLAVPRGAEVIDLSGLTVLPGLIDAHVHLAIGGPPAANALADLRAGFTTIVDMGSRTTRLLKIRDSINAGLIPGPRVLAAGVWVGVKGGVCEFGGIGIEGGVDQFTARIRDNAANGAEITKLCVTGWPQEAFDQPTKFEMPVDVLSASVREAHRLGRIAVAHDLSIAGVRAALDAGVDGLAHAAYVDSAAAQRMRAAGVFMIPTLASLAPDSSPASVALIAATALARRLGVRLVFGTDGGVLPHGRNAEEFAALARAGLSPLEMIRAATVNAAAAFRIADSVGLVRPGMVADFVAVNGDPLSDISVLLKPALVMSRGKVAQ